MIVATYKQMLDYMVQTDADIVSQFEEKFPQGGEVPSYEQLWQLSQARMEILGNTVIGMLTKMAAEEKKHPNLILTN